MIKKICSVSAVAAALYLMSLNLGIAAAPSEEAAAGTVQVTLAKATPRNLQNKLAVYGTVAVDANGLIDVNVPYDSVVEQVLVRAGQSIKQGAPLLRIKPAAAAQIAYVQAETALASAQASFARSQRLLQDRLATQADVEAAHKTLIDAQAAMFAQHAQTQINSEHYLRASIDATIVQSTLAEGQQITAGTTLMQLAPVQQRCIYLSVAPEQRSHLRIGQTVDLISVFDRRQVLVSTVAAIHETINPVTRLIDIVVSIPTSAMADWLPGQQVSGYLIIGEEKVLAVPRTALLDDERGTYLYRANIDQKTHKNTAKAEKVYVTTGVETQEYIAINDGVRNGDDIVVSGNYELSDGQEIVEEKIAAPPLTKAPPIQSVDKQSTYKQSSDKNSPSTENVASPEKNKSSSKSVKNSVETINKSASEIKKSPGKMSPKEIL